MSFTSSQRANLPFYPGMLEINLNRNDLFKTDPIEVVEKLESRLGILTKSGEFQIFQFDSKVTFAEKHAIVHRTGDCVVPNLLLNLLPDFFIFIAKNPT